MAVVLVNHVAFNHVQSSNLTVIKMLTKTTLGTESYLLIPVNPVTNSDLLIRPY